MTEILFIRHGRTAENTAKRFQGHSDTNLDEVGRWQALRLAERLANEELTAIYTSDLARARQTAEPMAASRGIPIEARADLREVDVGQATGLTKDELRERLPAIFGVDWHRVAFPGGESYEQTTARVSAAARQIAAAHPNGRIAAVTHGGAIRAAISGLTEIPIQTLASLFVLNTSITRIVLDRGGRGHLLSLNDAAHLEPWAVETLGERRPGARRTG